MEQTEVVEPQTPVAAEIDIGLWSRWTDKEGRLFMVVDKFEPAIWNGKYRKTQLRVVNVGEEFSHQISLDQFEASVHAGKVWRLRAEEYSLYLVSKTR